MPGNPLLSAGTLLCVAFPLAFGQTARYPFVPGGRCQVPPVPHVTAAFTADLDGDGDLDLVLAAAGSSAGRILVLENRGGGVFREGSVIPIANKGIVRGFLAGDLDLDGDTDFLFLQGTGAKVFSNDGKGGFRDVTNASLGSFAKKYICGMGDVDGDGDPDLLGITPFSRGRSFLLLNDGKGRFHSAPSLVGPPIFYGLVKMGGFGFFDADGDGDLDYLSVSSQGGWELILAKNDGKGDFRKTSVVFKGTTNISNACTEVSFADFDRDGDTDLFVEPASLLLFNDGKGGFKDVTISHLAAKVPAPRTLAMDLDGDGNPELVLGSFDEIQWMKNLGKGKFGLPKRVGSFYALFPPFLAGDFDGDKDPDLLAAEDGRPLLLLNDGRGRFAGASGALLPWSMGNHREEPIHPLALGDVDGDGDLDVVGDTRGGNFALFLNRGDGTFSPAPPGAMPVKPPRASSYQVTLKDFDGDGDLDFLALDAGNSPFHLTNLSVFFLNDGKGKFRDVTKADLPPNLPLAVNVGFAEKDFDGDGDLDVVCASYNGSSFLLRNDGKGKFSLLKPFSFSLVRWSVAVAGGDLDGDGDEDLVWMVRWGGERIRVFKLINDGKGNFTPKDSLLTAPTMFFPHGRLILEDLDGDGDLDLAAGIEYRPNTYILLNDGKGNFKGAQGSPMAGFLMGLDDMDGDGDPDLVLKSPQKKRLLLLLNDGRGRFGPPSVVSDLFETDFRDAVVAGDLDGSGLPDLVCAGPARYLPWVFFNPLRHLRAPWVCKAGKLYRIQAFGLPSQSVLLFVGQGKGATPLPPLGTLRLDTRGLFALPPIPILWGPSASWEGKVPGDPALLGREVFFQALILDPLVPSRSRFTGVVEDRVTSF